MAQGLTLVADSSAWIAFFRSQDSPAKLWMADAIENHRILIPDLVFVEVIRGIDSEREAKAISDEFDNFEIIWVGGRALALQAAGYYRLLRSRAITVRSTVDLMIASWCIENDIPLIHTDRDFDGFEKHLGLLRWPVL